MLEKPAPHIEHPEGDVILIFCRGGWTITTLVHSCQVSKATSRCWLARSSIAEVALAYCRGAGDVAPALADGKVVACYRFVYMGLNGWGWNLAIVVILDRYFRF